MSQAIDEGEALIHQPPILDTITNYVFTSACLNSNNIFVIDIYSFKKMQIGIINHGTQIRESVYLGMCIFALRSVKFIHQVNEIEIKFLPFEWH